MSAATRFLVVRQLTRVSGSTYHSNTHWEPATGVMPVPSVEVSIPLEMLAATIPEGADQSSEPPAKACCHPKAIVPDTTRMHAHGSNHRPPFLAIRVNDPACLTVCPRRRLGSWTMKPQ